MDKNRNQYPYVVDPKYGPQMEMVQSRDQRTFSRYPYPQPQLQQPGPVAFENSQMSARRSVRNSDCLVFSIVNLLFCGFWLGIPVVIFSCRARDYFDQGCTQGNSEAKIAKILNIIGITVGLILTIVAIITYTILYFTVYQTAVSTLNTYNYGNGKK